MKIRLLLLATLSLLLVACGGSSEPAEAGAGNPEGSASTPAETPAPAAKAEGSTGTLETDPAKLPDDKDGIVKAYKDLMGEVASVLEGIKSKDDLDSGLEKIAALKPAFLAVMKQSENLGVAVDGVDAGTDTAVARMEKAIQGVVKKFPMEALSIMQAFGELTGGVGGR